MVSIRRRRNLGYTTGVLSLDMLCDNEGVAYFITPPGTPEDQPVRPETRTSSSKPSSPKRLRSSSSASQSNQPKVEGSTSGVKKPDLSSPDGETNPRKKRKRNHTEEPEKLKGVYFKNQKWQAAIKVDKRQIHLGTFDSQAEAARVYDRAAFLCGRSPNSELPKEDIEELIKLTWDQFLIKTQDDIFYKSSRKRRAAARQPSKSNSPVIKPRAKRALSFSKGPKPEGSNPSRRRRAAARPPSKPVSPVIDPKGKRAAARPPSKSVSPVIDPKGKRALTIPEDYSEPEGGWLWPLVEPEGSNSSRRKLTAARPPSKSISPGVDPKGKRALSVPEDYSEPEGGWLWPLVEPAGSDSSRRLLTTARSPSKSISPVSNPRGKRALSFSGGPEPGSNSSRRRAAARPPRKSSSPVTDPRGKRALSFSEEYAEPEGGWLWPIVPASANSSES